MRSSHVLAVSALVGVAVGLVANFARAVNTTHPRTPVLWPADVACAQTVDKAQTATLHFDYAVPVDDTEKGDDEPDDGRTHQFFAFAQQPETEPPTWITQADITSALEANALFPADIPDDDDVLESSSAWPADSWQRITADDARVPITMEQAAMGFDWDLTDVPPGTYVIGGYTWEPPINLWVLRPGYVRITEGETTPPGMRIVADEDLLASEDAPASILGCLDADGAATVDVAWRPAGGIDTEWTDHETGVDASSGAFAYDFRPDDAVFAALEDESLKAILLRFTLQDGNGQTYAAYTPTAILVDIPTGSGTEGDGEEGSDSGCACEVTDAPHDLAWFLLLPLLGWRRRW